MEEDFVYQIKIKDEEGFEILIYLDAPENSEDSLLDFMWQKYFEFQPDKSYYKITNISKECNRKIDLEENMTQIHLACKHLEYSKNFQ